MRVKEGEAQCCFFISCSALLFCWEGKRIRHPAGVMLQPDGPALVLRLGLPGRIATTPASVLKPIQNGIARRSLASAPTLRTLITLRSASLREPSSTQHPRSHDRSKMHRETALALPAVCRLAGIWAMPVPDNNLPSQERQGSTASAGKTARKPEETCTCWEWTKCGRKEKSTSKTDQHHEQPVVGRLLRSCEALSLGYFAPEAWT